MPWRYPDNVPRPAKNWPAEDQRICTDAANAALKRTGDDGEAIRACIGAVKQHRKKEGRSMSDLEELDDIELADDEEGGERDSAKEAQRARSKKYGIAIKDSGNVTKPGQWSHVPESQFLDPVNFRYPCPDAKQTRAAASYWGMPRNRAQYSSEEQAKISARLNRMKKKYGIGEYAEEEGIDLRSVMTLDLTADGAIPSAIPIHVLGTWTEHFAYPPFQMTETMMDQAIANFDARTLRPNAEIAAQIVVDDRHAGGQANGWATRLFKALPYLMAEVDWTDRGRNLVSQRAFRFVSPVYTEHLTRDGVDHGVVFKEITLTNRNFLKELPAIDQPILLSDDVRQRQVLDQDPPPKEGSTHMSDKPKDQAPKSQDSPAPEDNSTRQLSEAQWQELQDKLTAGEQALKQLAEVEAENRALQVKAAIKAAGARGVDAFTLNTMNALLLQLPRKAEATLDIVLEEGKAAQKVNLYQALMHFLEEVPGVVPPGEQTLSETKGPPKGDETKLSDDEKARAKRLADAASDELPLDSE